MYCGVIRELCHDRDTYHDPVYVNIHSCSVGSDFYKALCTF